MAMIESGAGNSFKRTGNALPEMSLGKLADYLRGVGGAAQAVDPLAKAMMAAYAMRNPSALDADAVEQRFQDEDPQAWERLQQAEAQRVADLEDADRWVRQTPEGAKKWFTEDIPAMAKMAGGAVGTLTDSPAQRIQAGRGAGELTGEMLGRLADVVKEEGVGESAGGAWKGLKGVVKEELDERGFAALLDPWDVLGPGGKLLGALGAATSGGRLAKAATAAKAAPKFSKVKDAPKNTTTAYKLLRKKKDGSYYPLFVDADTKMSAGEWLRAVAGETGKGGKVKSKLGLLANRPGWHSSTTPTASHIGGVSTQGARKPDYRPASQVWVEVEVGNDVDWQSNVNELARKSRAGEIVPRTAQLTEEVPYGGHYSYRTNTNQENAWVISGEMRILDELEQGRAVQHGDLPSLPEVIAQKNLSFDDLTASAKKELQDHYPEVHRKMTTGEGPEQAVVTIAPEKRPYDKSDAIKDDFEFWKANKRREAVESGDFSSTPNFKKWFGGSVVVDEVGDPMRVYHGASRDIGPEFRTQGGAETTGNPTAVWGSFFTPSPQEASRYASFHDFKNPVGQNITPVYLSIKNPKRMTREEWNSHAMSIADPKFGGGGLSADVAIKAEKEFRDKLIGEGFDGVIIGGGAHRSDQGFNAEYVAFHPTQIKSSISNTGKFDPDNPSITNGDSPKPETGLLAEIGKKVGKKSAFDVKPQITKASFAVPAVRRREKMREGGEGETIYEDQQVINRNIITPEDLQGAVGVPIQGDRSRAGAYLTQVGGVPLTRGGESYRVPLQGGEDYPLATNPGMAWASNIGPARSRQNIATKAAEATGSDVTGVFTVMGERGIDFSLPVIQGMVGQLESIRLPKSAIKKFDSFINDKIEVINKFRERPMSLFVGLDHDDAMKQLMGVGGYAQEGAGELRKLLVQEMAKGDFRHIGFPVYHDVMKAVTKPELMPLSRGDSGTTILRLEPGADLSIESGHQSYSHGIPGGYLGGLEEAVPPEVMFPKAYEKTARLQTKIGKPFSDQDKIGWLGMAEHWEVFDQEWVDKVSEWLRSSQAKKAGAAMVLAPLIFGAAQLEQLEG